MVTLAPIASFELGRSSSPCGLEFAPLGLANMLNGGGAVRALHAERLPTAARGGAGTGDVPSSSSSSSGERADGRVCGWAESWGW